MNNYLVLFLIVVAGVAAAIFVLPPFGKFALKDG